MQFLKALFWLIVGFVVALFMYANREEIVSIKLWANLVAEVKLPALIVITFLIGFLPTFIVYRARLWSLRRRLETQVQTHVANHPVPARVAAAPGPGEGGGARGA
jgi:uncharacterized membrane protein YciS (DUF1049 family)